MVIQLLSTANFNVYLTNLQMFLSRATIRHVTNMLETSDIFLPCHWILEKSGYIHCTNNKPTAPGNADAISESFLPVCAGQTLSCTTKLLIADALSKILKMKVASFLNHDCHFEFSGGFTFCMFYRGIATFMAHWGKSFRLFMFGQQADSVTHQV